jgi:hypothetical protein
MFLATKHRLLILQTPQLPVTEINSKNAAITDNPRFFDQPKPVHSVQAAIYFQQGLDNDPERGPIGSNAHNGKVPAQCMVYQLQEHPSMLVV